MYWTHFSARAKRGLATIAPREDGTTAARVFILVTTQPLEALRTILFGIESSRSARRVIPMMRFFGC